MAAVLASRKDCAVRILTGHPEQWHNEIRVTDLEGKEYVGTVEMVSSNAQLVEDVDIVLLCLPGYLIEPTLCRIAPYVKRQAIGSIVSSTGFFLIAHKVLNPSVSLFGFQRAPYIARVDQYGQSGKLLGYKSQLWMAVENLPNSFIAEWETLLQTPVGKLSNYLEASLTNSNPLLHPARLYGMWHNWSDEIIYPRQSYFYAEWDKLSAELYIAMDSEFQMLTKKLDVKITDVLTYYDCYDALSLMDKLRSIEAFKPILAPMKQTMDGWVPDFDSRYFTEDFPYGLRFVYDLAKEYDVSTPTIDKIYGWGISRIK